MRSGGFTERKATRGLIGRLAFAAALAAAAGAINGCAVVGAWLGSQTNPTDLLVTTRDGRQTVVDHVRPADADSDVVGWADTAGTAVARWPESLLLDRGAGTAPARVGLDRVRRMDLQHDSLAVRLNDGSTLTGRRAVPDTAGFLPAVGAPAPGLAALRKPRDLLIPGEAPGELVEEVRPGQAPRWVRATVRIEQPIRLDRVAAVEARHSYAGTLAGLVVGAVIDAAIIVSVVSEPWFGSSPHSRNWKAGSR